MKARIKTWETRGGTRMYQAQVRYGWWPFYRNVAERTTSGVLAHIRCRNRLRHLNQPSSRIEYYQVK